jgi:hypothetical protein
MILSEQGKQVLNHTIALNPDPLLIQNASNSINQVISGGLAYSDDADYRKEKMEKQFKDLLGFARFHKVKKKGRMLLYIMILKKTPLLVSPFNGRYVSSKLYWKLERL